MKVSLDDLEHYGDTLNTISQEASKVFSQSLRQYISEMTERYGDIDTWPKDLVDQLREYATDLVVEIWNAYGDASSSVGSMFFEDVLGDEIPEQATMTDHVSRQRAEQSVRYWMKNLFGDKPDVDKFVDGCTAFVDRQVSHSADMAVIDGANELAMEGKEIRYGRVPVGPTCGFCIMLASRGFVYASKKSAGDEGGAFNRFHDYCNCRVVAGYEGIEVEGYDYQGMYERYLKCREAIGDYEQVRKDWNALTPEERDEYGRGERVIPLSEDPKKDAELRKQLGKQADGFNDYLAHRIIQEMNTRDRQWMYDKTPLPEPEKESGAKPKKKELKTEEKLRPAGYRMIFRKPTEKGRTSDVYFVSGSKDDPVYTKWEMKHSEGDPETRIIGKSNIRNQFKNARGQSRNLIIDVEDVIGFTDTDGNLVDREYLIEAAQMAIVHHEVAPWFDEAIIVFGENDFLKIRKPNKEA